MIIRTRQLFLIAWHLTRGTIHELEYEPRAQFKWHYVMTVSWFIAMVLFTLAFFTTGGFGTQFGSGQVWLLFFTLWVSLYANFATDFDAMSAALAGMIASRVKDTVDGKGVPDGR